MPGLRFVAKYRGFPGYSRLREADLISLLIFNPKESDIK